MAAFDLERILVFSALALWVLHVLPTIVLSFLRSSPQHSTGLSLKVMTVVERRGQVFLCVLRLALLCVLLRNMAIPGLNETVFPLLLLWGVANIAFYELDWTVFSRLSLSKRLCFYKVGAGRISDSYNFPLAFKWVVFGLEGLIIFSLIGFMPAYTNEFSTLLAASSAIIIALGAVSIRTCFALRRNKPKLAQKLGRRLSKFNPSFAIHYSAPAENHYQLDQWLSSFDSYWEAKGKKPNYFLIIREAYHVDRLRKWVKVPIVFAPKLIDLDHVLPASVKAVFYVNNSVKNAQVTRYTTAKHVLLLHGESDKQASANPFSKIYDELFVAGKAAIERYAKAGVFIPAERFKTIGRPVTKKLSLAVDGESLKTIIYAPTWEGYFSDDDHSSLDSCGLELVKTICRDYPDHRIIYKPHPHTGYRLKSYLEASNQIAEFLLRESGRRKEFPHIVVGPKDKMILYDVFNKGYLLITDLSSTVADFLYTERPMIVTNAFGMPAEAVYRDNPTLKGSYLLEPNLANLSKIMSSALTDDPLRADRKENKKYILGDFDCTSEEQFHRELARLSGDGRVFSLEERAAFTPDLSNPFVENVIEVAP